LIVYLDTSVIVSIVAFDATSGRAGRWYEGLYGPVIISDLANLEVCAVISRDLRSRRFSRAVADKARTDFDALRATSERWSHGALDFTLADRLVRDYSMKLSAPDALHLASAKNAGATLATFDARLVEAARAQRVEVAEPG
jgi:predicted nucleic acid-binding protein